MLLTFRRFDTRVLPSIVFLALAAAAQAQDAQTPAAPPAVPVPPAAAPSSVPVPPPGAPAPPVAQPPAGPPAIEPPTTPTAPSTAGAAAAGATAGVQNAKPTGPDYPDPRTLTIGAMYWMTLPVASPDLRGGQQALYYYETLEDLGKVRPASPGIQVSFPITRTGELHFEYFQVKGDGNQNAPNDIFILGTNFNKGDYLSSQYSIQATKLYLDDLLFPHKFPVAKFRLKSLWEFQYVHMKSTIDAPFVGEATGVPQTAIGTKQIFLPTFGLAAEYALAKHLLLRVDASGFGWPHKAYIWDGQAAISYRFGSWELRGGFKTSNFKTSPNSEQYLTDRLAGAFVGLQWHWSL